MKRRTSLLTALAMLVTSFTMLITAGAASFTDVSDDYKYKDAITTLANLDVINGYDDGTFKPDQTITRAEFTKIIVYMLGCGSLTEQITQFTDVPTTHFANANIKVAFDRGIINGYDDTTFMPDSPVTYEQALKMIVCTLGYQPTAEESGGYPEGYITEAVRLDLTKNITDTQYTDNATRGAVAQIMYNALEVDIQEKSGTDLKITDKTLLNDYLNVYQLKGTVVGVETSKISGCNIDLHTGQMSIADSAGDEYVIDFSSFADYAEINAYLGQTVSAYYREDNASTDKWLVAIDNEIYENKEVTVLYRDLDECSDLSVEYYKEDASKTSTIKLDKSDLTIRYNGRIVEGSVELTDADGNTETYSPTDALEQWLTSTSDNFIYGNVKFIDSGSTGKYNVVDIYDYENIVAYAVPTTDDYRITDKTKSGNYLILDPDDSSYTYTITRDNKTIAVTDIKKDEVVSYAKSLDGDLYTVYVSSGTVSGEITGLNIDRDRDKNITVADTKYYVTDRFLDYIADKEQKELKTGITLTAHTDFLGNLEWAAVSASTKYYPYAYVVNAEQDGEGTYLTLYAPATLPITTFSSGTTYKVDVFKVAQNVKLNGKRTTPTSVLTTLRETAETSNPDTDIANYTNNLTGYNQLVRIYTDKTTNDDGTTSNVVTEIMTINAAATEGSNNEDDSSIVRFKAMDASSKYYVTSTAVKASKTGATYYSLKSSTPMFVIPKDRTATNSYSLKSALSNNTMAAGGSYYLDAYDVNKSKYPSCLIVYNTTFKTGTSITYSTAYRLVAQDVEEEYVESESDTYWVLHTFNSSKSETKTNIAGDYVNLFSSLSQGDVILNGTDGDKHADTLMLAIDYDEVEAVLNGATTTVTDEDGNTSEQTYNWTKEQEQTEENNWQKYTFDFRYPKSNLSEPTDDYYITGGNVTNISSRAAIFNLLQIVTDDNLIYVTKNGFDESGTIDESDYEIIKVSSSTVIMRYDSDEEEFTPYVKGSEKTALTISDLKEAINYGDACSKILVTYVSGSTTTSTSTPTAKFIVIYN